MLKIVVVVALAALAAGCTARTRAQGPIERPTLDVPPVPPRVIEQEPPPPPVAQIEPVPELPPPPVDTKPIKRSPRDTAARETQKPEPEPKPETPAPDTAAAQPPQNTQPAPELRTPAVSDTAAASRRISQTLLRAQQLLEKIDYHKLTDGGRNAYNQTKNLIEGADAELKKDNYELAQKMADTAEKLANELQSSDRGRK